MIWSTKTQQEEHMRRCIELAMIAKENGGAGCVIVDLATQLTFLCAKTTIRNHLSGTEKLMASITLL